jgi:hypothetical protein
VSAPNCPTCGFVMCEGFDEERINDVATLATPNGEFACLSGRCEETGLVVDCAVCRMRKPPRGRSVAAEAANGMCGPDCPGYRLDPQVNDLWPGEKRWQFGYPTVPPYEPHGDALGERKMP